MGFEYIGNFPRIGSNNKGMDSEYYLWRDLYETETVISHYSCMPWAQK